ncbi:MAG: MaoC/PaaZ C-terminal domain-containing protein, partial [Acidimicrobiales bacterium]
MRESEIEVGERRQMVLVDGLTRTRIVQYAGASGDFNPLHTDEHFAREKAGFPTVFAHGMLTMGMTGRIVTDWVGADRLRSYGARFIGQVWPGDTLTAIATVESVRSVNGESLVELRVLTRNQRGEDVLTGTATAGL